MPKRDQWNIAPILRFPVVGGSNTLLTALILVALSSILPGTVAFTITFTLGIVYALILTGRWAFGSDLTVSSAVLFVASYFVIYLCGLVLVAFLGDINAPPWANGASVLLTAPLSFIAGRFIFTRFQLGQADST